MRSSFSSPWATRRRLGGRHPREDPECRCESSHLRLSAEIKGVAHFFRRDSNFCRQTAGTGVPSPKQTDPPLRAGASPAPASRSPSSGPRSAAAPCTSRSARRRGTRCPPAASTSREVGSPAAHPVFWSGANPEAISRSTNTPPTRPCSQLREPDASSGPLQHAVLSLFFRPGA